MNEVQMRLEALRIAASLGDVDSRNIAQAAAAITAFVLSGKPTK